jgi:23S rRNA G2445 N2-methylase RlmL
MTETAFAKRVKRRVTARVHEFFIVCPPGLRSLCLRELTCLDAAVKNIQKVPGGVMFSGRLMDACAANLWMRSPSRILMRLARFRATNFADLEKKFQAIDWELFLPAGTDPDIQVTTHTSRLYHTGAVAQRCRAVIRAALGSSRTGNGVPANERPGGGKALDGRSGDDLGKSDLKKNNLEVDTLGRGDLGKNHLWKSDLGKDALGKYDLGQYDLGRDGLGRDDLHGQTVMIRSENDGFDVSLDMSGAPLYKRGIKTRVAEAPLRENLAFAILDASGFTPEDLLVDPMCGSGTFALEGAMIQAHIPPGYFRRFACEAWPAFSPAAFAYARSMAAEQFRPAGPVFASDIDPGAVAAAAANLAGHAFLSPVQVSRQDFFDLVPDRLSRKKGVLVLNPPYGRRLEKRLDTKAFYREIAQKLKIDFKGWRVGLIFPQKQFSDMNFLKLQPMPFFHGGLNLAAGIGTI